MKKNKAKTIKLHKKKKNWLYYLNYKNLSAEIQQYGYVFSMQKTVLAIVLTIVVSILSGIIFKLETPYIVIIAIANVIAVPQLIINNYHNMYQQRRFSDANLYMEQFLYSFSKKKNILEALKDVESVFTDGPMKQLLKAAVKNIEFCYDNSDIEEESLAAIEKEYSNKRIRRINNFILKARAYGGDIDGPTDVLLHDRAMWETRTIEYQNDRKKGKRNAVVCIFITIITCLVPLYILPQEFDITKSAFTQVTATLFLIACMILYVRADKKMTIDWLANEKQESDEVVEQYYTRYVMYDIKKEFKSSLKYLLIPAIMLILGYTLKWRLGYTGMLSKILSLMSVGICLCILLSCYIGKNICYKKLCKEVQIAFPEWLIEIAILIQTENVQTAIEKSVRTAPAVMRTSLIRFLEELEERPTQVEPYANFMKELHINEIEKSMKLLYSFSEGKAGNKAEQIRQILERNAKLTDKAEREQNSETMVSFQAFILYPAFIGMFKLCSDLLVFCTMFLVSTNNIL